MDSYSSHSPPNCTAPSDVFVSTDRTNTVSTNNVAAISTGTGTTSYSSCTDESSDDATTAMCPCPSCIDNDSDCVCETVICTKMTSKKKRIVFGIIIAVLVLLNMNSFITNKSSTNAMTNYERYDDAHIVTKIHGKPLILEKSDKSNNNKIYDSTLPMLLPLSPQPLIQENSDLCNSNSNNNNDNNNRNKEEEDYDFRKKSGLFCIITGLEHSGTTMASRLVMNAPHLYGAFELGLLLSENPRGFRHVKPQFFYESITKPVNKQWWGITNNQREKLLEAKCHAEQYNLLRKYSPIYQVHNSSWIVDKTPRYYRTLYSIMQRTPKVPVIVTQKDDESIIRSFQKRGTSKKGIEQYLTIFHHQLKLSKKHFPERLFIMNQTAFTEDPDGVMVELFKFLGLQWDTSYLTNDAFNQKGGLLGIHQVPGFNRTRSECKDCKVSGQVPTAPIYSEITIT